MIKKLMLGTALAALMLTGATAQTPGSSSPSPAPAASSGHQADLVTSQKPEQLLASNFKGTDVVGTDDKKIGDVTDILFDKDGKIEAYVVSVGGFLGMGAKEVALAPSAFDVVPDKNGGVDKLRLSMSQDQLKEAQNFKPYAPPHATTTGSSTPGGSPLTGGTRPAMPPSPAGR
jgi:sporulation protein YlmC with PRC-barrel domain